MKRFFALACCSVLSVMAVNAYDYSSYSANFTSSDYRTALNMGLKFFGGQRCGDTHNWMLENNPNVTKKYCHMKDGQGSVNGGANGSYDLTGGWHDCGDHIKVATTMGYAAVSLLAAYDIWPTAFQDNYDEAYGAANGIPDVLDEAKVATDYFIKSFPDASTFVYYVGNSSDHRNWVTSSYQSDMGVAEGGDPRPISTTTSTGGPQAANYCSALALMAMHYPDAAYCAKCKASALVAYNYAKNYKSVQQGIPEFYSSPNSEWTDELSLAAILMYRLTGDDTYKTEALSYLQNKWESNSPLAWDTEADYAYYYITKAAPTANNGSGGYFYDFLRKNVYVLHIPAGTSDANGFPYYKSTWGTNKLACGGAVAAALYCKLVKDGVITTSYDTTLAHNFNQRIVDYMLGNNEFGHTFIHGFKGDMTFRIHHRNAMGRNDNPPSATKNSCDFMFASGGLIGGPSATGVFKNVVEDNSGSFTYTEGGCDYNGPFVAAIASIVAQDDPVSNGVRTVRNSLFNVYPTAFDDYIIVDPVEVDYNGDAVADLISITGQSVLSARVDGYKSTILYTSSLPRGIYLLKVSSSEGCKTYKVVKY